MSTLYYESSIAHHGIKGQKWGVRRYQNPDGTLTKAGQRKARRDRYEGGKLQEKFISNLDSHGKKLSEKGATYQRLGFKYLKEAMLPHFGSMAAAYVAASTATPVGSAVGTAILAGNTLYQAVKGAKLNYDMAGVYTHVQENRRKQEMKVSK